jgi:HlyD family secretion protein
LAQRSIFRQAALNRLSSPDQLDRLMHVTTPRGWVALAGLCLVLLFALLWSVFGNLPTTITGTGILLSSAGILEIEVQGSGVVTDLRVAVGDKISRGDTIARVGQPQLQQRVEQSRDRLRILQAERRRRTDFTATNEKLETEGLNRSRSDLTRRLGVADERIRFLEGRQEAEREALTLGLITPETVQNTLQLLEAARSERNGLESAIQNNELERLLLANRSSETIEGVDQRIRDAEQQFQESLLSLGQSATVVSPYAGYVREIRSDVGQLVSSGQALASVEMVDAPLQAVVFVPTQGKRIRSGMDAQVSPVTVQREEYGFLLGKVSFVSPQPATLAGMQRTLGNEILVNQLVGAGAPFLVEVDLERDPATTSGFRWSSGSGPPMAVESGTLVSVQVVVERQRPISLVIPALRGALGTS